MKYKLQIKAGEAWSDAAGGDNLTDLLKRFERLRQDKKLSLRVVTDHDKVIAETIKK